MIFRAGESKCLAICGYPGPQPSRRSDYWLCTRPACVEGGQPGKDSFPLNSTKQPSCTSPEDQTIGHPPGVPMIHKSPTTSRKPAISKTRPDYPTPPLGDQDVGPTCILWATTSGRVSAVGHYDVVLRDPGFNGPCPPILFTTRRLAATYQPLHIP